MNNLLDLPETTIKRAGIIQNKYFLRNVYINFYSEIEKNLKNIPPGKIVEIGSGGGFIKHLIPKAVTSDIMTLPNCDLTFSAESMSFKNNSMAAFVMLNVFHNIKNPKKALSEFQRCLKKGGKVIMIEPFNSFLSRFVFQNFHNETFDPNGKWVIKEKGNLSGANGALPWIIFDRDFAKYQKQFPGLRLISIKPHTPLSYLFSGGFSLPQILPSFLYQSIIKLEKMISPWNKNLGLFSTIVLEKC